MAIIYDEDGYEIERNNLNVEDASKVEMDWLKFMCFENVRAVPNISGGISILTGNYPNIKKIRVVMP